MVSLASSYWTSFVSVQFRLLHFLSQIDGTLRIWLRVYMTMSVIVSVLKKYERLGRYNVLAAEELGRLHVAKASIVHFV